MRPAEERQGSDLVRAVPPLVPVVRKHGQRWPDSTPPMSR
jgi:hypothetical protein